ncbi:MAG: hypothetical protein N2C14_08845 [Planctomycetales bacterium]
MTPALAGTRFSSVRAVAVIIVALAAFPGNAVAEDGKPTNQTEEDAFAEASAAKWREVFFDQAAGDWKERWFLDGEVGKVTTGPDGMVLTAGPEFKNDAHR